MTARASLRRAATDAETPRPGSPLPAQHVDRSALEKVLGTGLGILIPWRISVLISISTVLLARLCPGDYGMERWRRRPFGCVVCGRRLARKRRGRPRKTCSDACRSRLWRRGD